MTIVTSQALYKNEDKGKDMVNKKVLRRLRNTARDGAALTC